MEDSIKRGGGQSQDTIVCINYTSCHQNQERHLKAEITAFLFYTVHYELLMSTVVTGEVGQAVLSAAEATTVL